jgi:thioredoxin 1
MGGADSVILFETGCTDRKEGDSMSGLILTVGASNFEEEVLKANLPVLVDFWAQWCAPCRALAPILDQLALQFQGKLLVGKVNVDEQADLAARFGILNIPTLILFKDGEEVDRMVGLQSKAQLEAKIQKHL